MPPTMPPTKPAPGSATSPPPFPGDWNAVDEARLAAYRFLAFAASDPRSARWARLRTEGIAELGLAALAWLASRPDARPAVYAPGEVEPSVLLEPDLGDFLDEPDGRLAAGWQAVHGLVSTRAAPPYETEYCPQTFSVTRSQKLADVAGFYRAFGLEPSRDAPERHDHVALELEFMAWLIAKQRQAEASGGPAAAGRVEVCRDAQRRFLADHLAWWLPAFALALRRRADSRPLLARQEGPPVTFLGALARALAAFVPMERARFGLAPPTELAQPMPTEEPDAGCAGCSGEIAS